MSAAVVDSPARPMNPSIKLSEAVAQKMPDMREHCGVYRHLPLGSDRPAIDGQKSVRRPRQRQSKTRGNTRVEMSRLLNFAF